MSQQDAFDRIVSTLHEAAFDDRLWPSASVLIDEAIGMPGSHLVIMGGYSREDAEFVFGDMYYHGEFTELGREYARNFFPYDERIPRLLHLPDGRIVSVPELYTEQELKTSSTYNELLSWSGARQALILRMDGPDGTHIVWGFTDPDDPNGWSSTQVALTRQLLSHIRQFVRVRQAPGTLPLPLHISPVEHRADFGAQRIAALVLLIDPAERPRVDSASLAATLGLTRPESHIAAALAAGHSVRDIHVHVSDPSDDTLARQSAARQAGRLAPG